MKVWTAHLRDDAEPVLVREGFAWGALFFGPLWLAFHRAWIPAILAFAADLLIGFLIREPFSAVLGFGLSILLGLLGHDLRRWSMENRGYLLMHVVAARDETEALGRLLVGRPDLAARFMPPEAAR